MDTGVPTLIAINHDDYHANHVGRASDGRQFFLTTPFEPTMGASAGCEFLALFIFNPAGQLLDFQIESLGPRADMDEDHRRKVSERWMKDLGPVTYQRIEVVPFSVQKFGTTFGLIPREPEDEEDMWVVEMRPGNYMAFFEPWDSGDYDT